MNVLRNLYERGLKYTDLYKYFAEDLLSREYYKSYLEDCKNEIKVDKYIKKAAVRNHLSVFTLKLNREDVEEFSVSYYDEIDRFKHLNKPEPKPYVPSSTSKKYYCANMIVEICK